MTTKLAIRNSMETAQKIQHALANGLISAAQIYREYVDAGGDPMALREHVQMNAAMWRMLDGVAMGAIDSRVFLMPLHVQRALLKMPLLAQARYIDRGVDVVSSDGSAIKIELHFPPRRNLQKSFPCDLRVLVPWPIVGVWTERPTTERRTTKRRRTRT